MTNDNFSSAVRLIGFGDNSTGNNAGFTGEAGEPILSGTANTAWWKYTAPSNGTLTIDTNGSGFDTFLGVFTGNSVDALTLVTSNDDGGADGRDSLVSFDAVRGTTYFIAVDGFAAATGDIALNLALTNETSGNNTDLIAIGDGLNNALNTVGLSGNDVLDGKGGADTLEGGFGVDTYFVDNINDRVINESIGGGIDQVFAKSDHVLDINVENLTLAGFDNLNGTGNDLDNVIEGNNGDNVLDGGDGNDSLFGGDGDDTIKGGQGNDSINGGVGFDTADYSNLGKSITLSGVGTIIKADGLGTDTVFRVERVIADATVANNTIDASQSLSGVPAVADLEAQTISALNVPGLGTLTFNVVNFDNVIGTINNDTIKGDAQNNLLSGLGGNDLIDGRGGNDQLFGGDGDDTLTGSDGDDILDGGTGIDTLEESGNVNFTLTNTTLTGLGADTFTNIESADLTGGIGNNTLNAINFTLGSVTLNGEAGNDLLIGGSQNDTLNGGEGNDTLAAKLGNDNVNGGNGTDIVTEKANVNFTLTNSTLTGLGTDTLTSIESSVLTGGIGNNSFNALTFTLGSVTLNGDAGNDVLRGGFKNDSLSGGDGDDVLRGAGSNNGLGSIDTLTGNAGNDTFTLSDSTTVFYNDGNNANAGLGDYALIKDFSSTFDKIQLEGAANLYVLGASPIVGVAGTAIYKDTNSNGAFNSTDELLAIVQGSGGLSLGSSYFTYA